MCSIGHSSLPAHHFIFGWIETFTFYTLEAEAFQETQKNGPANLTYLLFCKYGAICAENSPKRTSRGVARAIVKLNSLRSPSPIMTPDFDQHYYSSFRNDFFLFRL